MCACVSVSSLSPAQDSSPYHGEKIQWATSRVTKYILVCRAWVSACTMRQHSQDISLNIKKSTQPDHFVCCVILSKIPLQSAEIYSANPAVMYCRWCLRCSKYPMVLVSLYVSGSNLQQRAIAAR